jgi:hypothetical protein
MQQSLRWAAWGLTLALALPLQAADEKKDGKKKEDAGADPKAKIEKIASSGDFVGALTNVSASSQKDFTVQIRFKYLTLNPQAQANLLRQQQTLLQQQQRIMAIRNPAQRQQELLRLLTQAQQGPQNLYEVKEYKKDIELRAADDMKVRTLEPPVDYDDKGHVKKYTKKELQEMKGPGNLPGYTADFDSLRPNQVVRVYLAKKKAAEKKVAKKKDKEKDKDKKADDDDPEERKPEVVMIVVLKEPPAAK